MREFLAFTCWFIIVEFYQLLKWILRGQQQEVFHFKEHPDLNIQPCHLIVPVQLYWNVVKKQLENPPNYREVMSSSFLSAYLFLTKTFRQKSCVLEPKRKNRWLKMWLLGWASFTSCSIIVSIIACISQLYRVLFRYNSIALLILCQIVQWEVFELLVWSFKPRNVRLSKNSKTVSSR